MNIIEKIERNEQEAKSRKILNEIEQCPNCKKKPVRLKVKELKSRLFLVIVGSYVKKIWTCLLRLICPLCNVSFTYYPEFALPYKRYVKDEVLRLSLNYVEDDRATYRKVVKEGESAIGYDSEGAKIDERQLEGSTVWRWLSYLGSLKELLEKALDLIRQKAPSSKIFRESIHPIHGRKYESDDRRAVLGFALRLIKGQEEFKRVFFRSIFPDFATVAVGKEC